MTEEKTIIEKLTPEPGRLRNLNWQKMTVYVGAISILWVTVQALVPDNVAHVVGTILLGISNMIGFMMKSQKPFEETGERRERSQF